MMMRMEPCFAKCVVRIVMIVPDDQDEPTKPLSSIDTHGGPRRRPALVPATGP
jgi:hypothetical protein